MLENRYYLSENKAPDMLKYTRSGIFKSQVGSTGEGFVLSWISPLP